MLFIYFNLSLIPILEVSCAGVDPPLLSRWDTREGIGQTGLPAVCAGERLREQLVLHIHTKLPLFPHTSPSPTYCRCLPSISGHGRRKFEVQWRDLGAGKFPKCYELPLRNLHSAAPHPRTHAKTQLLSGVDHLIK